MSERGLVVSPPMTINGTSLLIKTGDLDPQEMRSNLLFWDKLDFPDNNLISFGLNTDSEFLLDAGVLQRTRIQFQGSGDMAQLALSAHLEAFRILDEQEPSAWSLATGDRSISFPDNELARNRGALVQLYDAIPVPDREVPLAELLEFKEKRRGELLALRHHMEEVFQKVISAGDGPLAWNTEVERLEVAIADHIKTSQEGGFRLRLANISANLNLTPIVVGSMSAYATDLPLLTGLLPGLAASISLDVSSALKGRKAVPTPFQYVTSYHKELFQGS